MRFMKKTVAMALVAGLLGTAACELAQATGAFAAPRGKRLVPEEQKSPPPPPKPEPKRPAPPPPKPKPGPKRPAPPPPKPKPEPKRPAPPPPPPPLPPPPPPKPLRLRLEEPITPPEVIVREVKPVQPRRAGPPAPPPPWELKREKAAGSGGARAQYELGLFYCRPGMRQNYKLAAESMRRAADQGLADAQYALGRLYEDGLGVNQDRVEALAWYRRAAAAGHLEAQCMIGAMYEVGDPVACNPWEAARLYQDAGKKGYARAQSNLARIYLFGGVDRDGGQVIAPDYSKALTWASAAAEQNDPQGQWLLGYMYQNGCGVREDPDRAAALYDAAAAQGYRGSVP